MTIKMSPDDLKALEERIETIKLAERKDAQSELATEVIRYVTEINDMTLKISRSSNALMAVRDFNLYSEKLISQLKQFEI